MHAGDERGSIRQSYFGNTSFAVSTVELATAVGSFTDRKRRDGQVFGGVGEKTRKTCRYVVKNPRTSSNTRKS